MAAQAKAKRLEYAVAVGEDGRLEADAQYPLVLPEGWQAEHLVLAGLVRCTLTALAYHARLSDIELTASGGADGLVTRRESDGRWGFVTIDCRMDVAIETALDADGVRDLIARAERGCFVGASLQPPPRYRWYVNGELV